MADALHLEYGPGRFGRGDGPPGLVLQEYTQFALASVIARRNQAERAAAAALQALRHGAANPPRRSRPVVTSPSSGRGRAIGLPLSRSGPNPSRRALARCSDRRPRSSIRAAAASCSNCAVRACATCSPKACRSTCTRAPSRLATSRSPRRRISPFTSGKSPTNRSIVCWSCARTSTASGAGSPFPRPRRLRGPRAVAVRIALDLIAAPEPPRVTPRLEAAVDRPPRSQPGGDPAIRVGTADDGDDDAVAVEEPLEIRLGRVEDGKIRHQPVSITMRTPGDDFELAAGFLFTEGILQSSAQVARNPSLRQGQRRHQHLARRSRRRRRRRHEAARAQLLHDVQLRRVRQDLASKRWRPEPGRSRRRQASRSTRA